MPNLTPWLNVVMFGPGDEVPSSGTSTCGQPSMMQLPTRRLNAACELPESVTLPPEVELVTSRRSLAPRSAIGRRRNSQLTLIEHDYRQDHQIVRLERLQITIDGYERRQPNVLAGESAIRADAVEEALRQLIVGRTARGETKFQIVLRHACLHRMPSDGVNSGGDKLALTVSEPTVSRGITMLFEFPVAKLVICSCWLGARFVIAGDAIISGSMHTACRLFIFVSGTTGNSSGPPPTSTCRGITEAFPAK